EDGIRDDLVTGVQTCAFRSDVTVECRANRGFHLQDPRVEVVVDAAVIAVDVSIKSMAIARNRNARPVGAIVAVCAIARAGLRHGDRKSTRLNSSHQISSYAV